MLIECSDCKREISDQENSCPHCGRPLEKPTNNKLQEEQSGWLSVLGSGLSPIIAVIIMLSVGALLLWAIITPTNNIKPDAADMPPAKLPAASGSMLYEEDVVAVVYAAQHNEVLFDMQYKGRPFMAIGRFQNAAKVLFSNDRYMINVAVSSGIVGCVMHDPRLLSDIVHWNPGQRVRISGLVSDTVLGNLELGDPCAVVAAP